MNQTRYSTGAIILHWLIAIMVIVNWRLVEAGHHLEDAARAGYMDLHKALGITILVLTLLRLGWRFTHRPPPLSDSLAGWEKLLARVTHTVFYILLIGLPLGGWLGTSFAGRPINYFGLFDIASLPVELDKAAAKTMFELHHTGGEIMIYLIGLHILGALKHMFWDKDGTMYRMLPIGKRPASGD